MNKVVKNVALVFVLVLLFVPTILVILDLLSITPWAGSTTAMFFNFFAILYSATIPAIALKVLELFGCCPTPQPNSQPSGQSNPNPPSGTSKLFPQNLAQTRNPLPGQGSNSSTNDNEDKTMKIVCTVAITIVLTFPIGFFIVALTLHNPYFYSMYLKPGIYVFMPNGNYYYYHPYGWPATNTTLIVLGGGDIDINDWAYPNAVTVQPGNYTFMITLTNINIFLNYFIDAIPTSVLISLIIAMILCELASRSEKH
jgi:hypothetical protein